MGAKEVAAARAALVATVANEVAQNGGWPVGDDNPHYAAAQKRLNEAIAEVDRSNDPWNNA